MSQHVALHAIACRCHRELRSPLQNRGLSQARDGYRTPAKKGRWKDALRIPIRAMNYQEFLASKKLSDIPTGFDPGDLGSSLFDFQRDIVRWACHRGRAAIFADCGLGKTPMQLEWANQVVQSTGGMVLILAPLGVTQQTAREGRKFGIEVKVVASQDECTGPGICVTNYEKLHRFNLSKFTGIVLDESSILKSYDGATRMLIIESARRVPHKLACTATPAPNDYMELGNHAEFLGIMSRTEMLSTFFVHDGGDTSKWRLKGHAESDFWRWLCSWSVNIRKPSDLGYEDGAFKLPKLNIRERVVQSSAKMDGYLFQLPASTLEERRSARRSTIDERVAVAVDLVNGSGDQWAIWCNLNTESEAIAKATGAEEIRGSTDELERERIVLGFLDGSVRCVVTKPSLWGFGLNLQCCHNTAFVGLSDSYEQFYQSLRRFWRFGQTQEVNAHIVISDIEGAVLANINRKNRDVTRMADEMARHMADISSAEIRGSQRQTETYNPTIPMTIPEWMVSQTK